VNQRTRGTVVDTKSLALKIAESGKFGGERRFPPMLIVVDGVVGFALASFHPSLAHIAACQCCNAVARWTPFHPPSMSLPAFPLESLGLSEPQVKKCRDGE